MSVSNGKVDMEIYAKHTVVATGRRGADWLEKLCAEHNIAHAARHRGYRRPGGGPQRDHGDGEPGAV